MLDFVKKTTKKFVTLNIIECQRTKNRKIKTFNKEWQKYEENVHQQQQSTLSMSLETTETKQ